MKSWLQKLGISAALDSGRPIAPSLQRKIASSDDLRRFQEDAVLLDQALKVALQEPEIPPSLHASIVRAVRAADRSTASRPKPTLLGWLPAPALAVLVLLGVWLLMRNSEPPLGRTHVAGAQPLALLTTALDMGDELAGAVPSVVVAPLSDELERFNRDLDNTAQFLLASLP